MLHAIDWMNFTPITSLLGGALIGLGTSLLITLRGKIAGISGIVGALMQFRNTPKDHHRWRILFLSGLICSGYFYALFAPLPTLTIAASFMKLVLAGLLVGFGTRMASGCTSGHGVCGLSRLSFRSLIATLSFMLAGFVVCYFTQHGNVL